MYIDICIMVNSFTSLPTLISSCQPRTFDTTNIGPTTKPFRLPRCSNNKHILYVLSLTWDYYHISLS